VNGDARFLDIYPTVIYNSNGSSSGPTYSFGYDPSTGMYLPAVSNLAWSTAGVERMRILSNGNVGIGCNAPAYTLDVKGSANISQALYFPTSVAYGQIQFAGTTDNTIMFKDTNAGGNNTGWLVGQSVSIAGSNAFGIARTVTNSISTGNGIYVLANSRTGINCNSPSYALDVSGIMNVSSNVRGSNFFSVSGEFYSSVNTNYYFAVVPSDKDYIVTACVRDQQRTNASIAACFICKAGYNQYTPWAFTGTPGIGMVNQSIFYYNNTGGDRYCYFAVQFSCGTH
jgi:hypothetical protein